MVINNITYTLSSCSTCNMRSASIYRCVWPNVICASFIWPSGQTTQNDAVLSLFLSLSLSTSLFVYFSFSPPVLFSLLSQNLSLSLSSNPFSLDPCVNFCTKKIWNMFLSCSDLCTLSISFELAIHINYIIITFGNPNDCGCIHFIYTDDNIANNMRFIVWLAVIHTWNADENRLKVPFFFCSLFRAICGFSLFYPSS